jgi:hypothetical protein
MRITIESEDGAGARGTVATTTTATPAETPTTVINAGGPPPALLQSLAPNMAQNQPTSEGSMDAGPPPETLVKAIERVGSGSGTVNRIDAGSAPEF